MDIEERLALSYLIERHGIGYVLQELANICDKKATYAAEKLQEARQANCWIALEYALRAHARNFHVE